MVENIMIKPYDLMNYFFQRKECFNDIGYLLITLGGLCGYACQMAAKQEKKNAILVKTGEKNYFFGEGLNYYLLESKNSFKNIIKNKFESIFPEIKFPDVGEMVKNVAKNVGNKNYKIGGVFNPEDKFYYYLEIWNDITDIIKNNCSKPEGWPILISLTLAEFISAYIKFFGKEKFIILLPIILENAFYTSKIIA